MEYRISTLLSHEALAYTWRQLAQRAGLKSETMQDAPFKASGINVHYANLGEIQAVGANIIVAPCTQSAWNKLLTRTSHSLDWLPSCEVTPNGTQLAFTDSIPVLCWGEGYEDGGKPFAEQRADGSIFFYVDIIATTFFMLTRWEETVDSKRDQYERFPAYASVAYKQGFLDRPIVDEYALVLRDWIKVLRPNWEPTQHKFSIRLSHDIDALSQFPNIKSFQRTFVGDIVKRGNPKRAWHNVQDYTAQFVAPMQTQYVQGIDKLSKLSNQHGLKSAFYFMAATPAPYDNGYDIRSSVVRYCIDNLREQGHEIGFHPGYHTLGNPELLRIEKLRLDAVLGETKYGGRQHYLRFCVPNTWRSWADLGLTYDSTLGYAAHEGFRCGTCHSFRPFDVERNCEINLVEYPLIVMDQTVYNYRGLSGNDGLRVIQKLARRCQQVEGVFSLLWHNTFYSPRKHIGLQYRDIVRMLASM